MAQRAELLISTVRETVTDKLREMILTGEFLPGTPLRQDEIAGRFGVSHIPVREAFRQLETEGMVTIRPRRGAVVNTLSTEELAEIVRLRQTLECEILGQAIPRITPERIQRAIAILDKITTDPKRSLYSGMNWQFHSELYKAADAPLTLDILYRLHRIGDRYLQNEPDMVTVDFEHRELVRLVEQGRKREAVALLKQHIGGLLTRVRAVTTSSGWSSSPRAIG